jgi:hypothetical protein
MIRISIPWIIGVFESLDGIDKVKAKDTVLEALPLIFSVQNQIEMIFDQSIYGSYLRVSREAAKQLHSEVGDLLDVDKKWEERVISDYEAFSLKEKKDKLKTVLLAEFSVVPSYLVSVKDSYDVAILVEAGLKLFPSTLMNKAPETEKDANEVGRALAFELPTACGFHTFRVIESVARRYWDQVTSGAARPRLETLGNLAAELEKNALGDAKIVEAIKQMTKLHRNPLIHPEVILTSEEAIGIIGMARSVIGAMLKVLPDAPDTTGAPLTLAESL